MARRNESALSERERLILSLAAEGLTDKEIAHRLDIGVATVRTYWDRMRRKLGTINRAQTIAKALSDDDRASGEHLLQAAYSQLAEARMLPIVVGEIGGRLIEANDGFLELSGYSLDEIASGSITMGDVVGVRHAAEMISLRLNGSTPPFVQELRHRNGTRIPVLLGATRLPGGTQLCAAYVIGLADVLPLDEGGAPRRLVAGPTTLLR